MKREKKDRTEVSEYKEAIYAGECFSVPTPQQWVSGSIVYRKKQNNNNHLILFIYSLYFAQYYKQ